MKGKQFNGTDRVAGQPSIKSQRSIPKVHAATSARSNSVNRGGRSR